MKKCLKSIIFCLCCLPLTVLAATLSQNDIQQIKQDMQTLHSAIETHDVESVLNLTHDSIYQQVASRDTMRSVLIETYKNFNQQQVKIHEYKIGEFGEVYQAGEEVAVFVPTQTVMEAQNRKLETTSYLLALKNGQGKWRYIDGSAFKQDPLQMWLLLPDLPMSVVIPPSEYHVISE